MNRQKYVMREIYEGLYDGPHATPPVSESGAIFLGISNITENGHIDYSDIRYINELDLPKWTKRVTPRGGDIVFSYEATLNLYAMIPDGFWGCLGRRMALIRPDESKALGKYLYYYFFSDEWRATIAENTIAGSTVDRIPIARFPEFPIALPELSIQKRIADILSAYDNLIENNQKQIRLLEEATQRIYKDWFVDMHFPGSKETNVINGVPADWNKGNLSNIVEFKRGKTITKAQVIEGKVPVVAGGLQPAYYHNVANTQAPVITVSGSGANAGFSRMYYEDVFASDCSYADIQATKSVYFVYCFLKANKYQLDALQKGSAQPHVYAKDINAMELMIPNEEIISDFCTCTEPLFKSIGVLQKQNAFAIEARDRLLPKLMSGDVWVR